MKRKLIIASIPLWFFVTGVVLNAAFKALFDGRTWYWVFLMIVTYFVSFEVSKFYLKSLFNKK